MWLEENIKVVINMKSAVFVATSVVDLIVDRMKEEFYLSVPLESFVLNLLKKDKESPVRRSILMSAAFHPVGHILAKEVVTKLASFNEDIKKRVVSELASGVDQLSLDKLGILVLKGLAQSL